MVNVTGWQELMNASPIQAAYVMFNTAWAGWIVIILFFVFQLMLYLKVRNVTTNFIIGIFFASMYLTGKLGATTVGGQSVMMILLALELGGILYFVWSK